jgi:AraC family transcriptional regulator
MSSRESSLEVYRSRIERALAYMQSNLGGELSLDGAAEAACFSKYHFHRIFSAAMGESFADYVRRLRLDRAANFLEHHPNMSVTEVALESGFSSPSVLSRLFAERFGVPPSAWREDKRSTSPRDGGSCRPWPCCDDGARARGAWPISTRMLPALRFASCLHIGPYGPGIHEAWSRLYRWAGPRGILGPSSFAAGVSWDNPELCPPESCRYSACIAIPDEIEPSGEVVLLAFPARNYLCLEFRGPEAEFAAAYDRLYGRVLPESGCEPEDAPAIELYKGPAGSPAGGASGFDLDIALPVKPLA